MLLLLQLIYLTVSADLATAWDWNNESQPISIFRSVRLFNKRAHRDMHAAGKTPRRGLLTFRPEQRPDLLAPILTPLEGIHRPDRMAPGYFFVAPYTNMQEGLYIYDNNAVSTWSSTYTNAKTLILLSSSSEPPHLTSPRAKSSLPTRPSSNHIPTMLTPSRTSSTPPSAPTVRDPPMLLASVNITAHLISASTKGSNTSAGVTATA